MQEKNKYRVLYLSRYVAEFLFYSVFPLYLKRLSYSGTQIGAILSFSPLLLVLALPIWSRFDSGKSRKFVLIIAAVFTIASQIFMSIPMPFVLFALTSVIYAIFKSPFQPSIDSMTTIFALENKMEFSSLRAYASLGYILGVVFGTLMIDRVSFIWILSISTAVFMVLILTTLSIKPLEVDAIKGENKSNLKQLFKNRYFIVFLISQILIFTTLNLNNSYDLLYLDSRGVNPSLFGISTIGRVSLEIICFSILSKFKISYKKLFTIIPIFYLAQSILYFLCINVYILIGATIMTGLASGAIIYANNKYISRIVRLKNITKAIYINLIIQSIFTAAFTFIGGIIIDKLGIRFVYFCTAICFFVSIFFVMIFFKNVEDKNVHMS